MKALPSLIFIVALFISSALTAQTKLPRSYDPGSLTNGQYFRQPFKSPIKQLITTDSLTKWEIKSRLNTVLHKTETREFNKDVDVLLSPGKIPANPKDYIDLNGDKVYKPKSSMGLMVY